MQQIHFVPIAPASGANAPEILASRLAKPRIVESKDLRPTPPERMMAAVLGPEHVPPGDPAEIKLHLSPQDQDKLDRANRKEQHAIGRQQAFFQVAQPPNGYANVELYAGSPAHKLVPIEKFPERLQALLGAGGTVQYLGEPMDRAELIVRVIRDCPAGAEMHRRLAVQFVDPHVRVLPPHLCKAVAAQLFTEAKARNSEVLGVACLEWVEASELEDNTMFLRFADNFENVFGGSTEVFRKLATMTRLLDSKCEDAGRLQLASQVSQARDCPAAALELMQEIGDDEPKIQAGILQHLARAGATRLQHADPQKTMAAEAWAPVLTEIWDQASRLDEPYITETYTYLAQVADQTHPGGSTDIVKRLVASLTPEERETGLLRLASLASRVPDCPAAASELLRNIGNDPAPLQAAILKNLAYGGATRLLDGDPEKRITREAWVPVLTEIWDRASRLPEPHITQMYTYLSHLTEQVQSQLADRMQVTG